MAITLKKQILRPGTFRLADGRVVTYTPADIANARAMGNEMLRRGLRVPICWEHDPEADPQTISKESAWMGHSAAWVARGYAGEAKSFDIRNGSLFANLVINDEQDANRIRNIGTVSPCLNWGWSDEKGTLWPGMTVGHIAVTPQPIDREQERFEMSQNANRVASTIGRVDRHYLSHASLTMDPTTSRIAAALVAMGILPAAPASAEELATTLEGMGNNDAPDNTMPAEMPPQMMSWLAKRSEQDTKDLLARVTALHNLGKIDATAKATLDAEVTKANLSHNSYDAMTFELKPLPVSQQIEALEKYAAGKTFARANMSQAKPANVAEKPVGDNANEAEAIKASRKTAEQMFGKVSKS